MTIDDILSRLDRVQEKRTGAAWTARCPAHEDTSPSLSIRIDDERIMLHCFAGCRTEDIIRRIGIGWTDLFLDRNKPREASAFRLTSARTDTWVNDRLMARMYREASPRDRKKQIRAACDDVIGEVHEIRQHAYATGNTWVGERLDAIERCIVGVREAIKE